MVGSIAVARQLRGPGLRVRARRRRLGAPARRSRCRAHVRSPSSSAAEPLGDTRSPRHAGHAGQRGGTAPASRSRTSPTSSARPTVLIDVTGGAEGAADGLRRAAAASSTATATVLVDIGGDAIATGAEPGLASPLCDAVMIAAAPPGSHALDPRRGMRRRAAPGRGAGADRGPRARRRLARRRGRHPGAGRRDRSGRGRRAFTEASMGVARCARGEFGEVADPRRSPHRRARPRRRDLLPLRPRAGRDPSCRWPRRSAGSSSMPRARDALAAIGIRTELDFEIERAREQRLVGAAPLSNRRTRSAPRVGSPRLVGESRDSIGAARRTALAVALRARPARLRLLRRCRAAHARRLRRRQRRRHLPQHPASRAGPGRQRRRDRLLPRHPAAPAARLRSALDVRGPRPRRARPRPTRS